MVRASRSARRLNDTIARLWCAGLTAGMLILLAPRPAAAQASAAPPLTFEAAIARALDANPDLSAARLRSPVAQAGVRVARERPNPEFRVEVEREAPTNAYTLALPLEVGGQRGRRIAVSDAAVRTTEAEIAATAAAVRAAVRRAYFGRLVADARLALYEDLQRLAARVRDAAAQRFDAGSAPRLDVLQAELALAQAENDAAAARAETEAARVTLNLLLAWPPEAATPLATALDPRPLPTLEAAVAAARAGSATLGVLDRRVDEARARIALARALQAPDVVSEAAVTRGSEPEFSTGWRAALSVTVPLFTRHHAAVAVEQASLTQITAEREAALAQITREVSAAARLAEASRAAYQAYTSRMLPQAAAVDQMADDAYRLGQTGLSAYLQSLQATRDVRLRALQAAADFHTATAELETAMGVPLP